MTLRKLPLLLLILSLTACGRADAQGNGESKWSIDIGKDSTATLRYDGTRAMSFKYIAWGPNWKFATVKAQTSKSADESIPFSGECGPLNTQWKGTVGWKDNALVYEWTFAADKASSGNIGGALAFDIHLDPAVFNANEIGQTEINSDEKGWSWTPLNGQTINVTFDGLPGKVAFEKGKKNNIRAWIIPGNIEPGTRKVTMTIALPAGTQYGGLAVSRYAEMNSKTWQANTIDWNTPEIVCR